MKILGHRGARFEKPENTILGFKYALEQNVDGIELDVRLTKDNQLVVIHDESIDRTSNGTGLVKDKSLNDLMKFDFGEGEKVPTLKEVIPLICEKAILFIELKDKGVELAVAEFVTKSGYENQCIIKSFDHRQLVAIHKEFPKLKLAALMVGTPCDPAQLAESSKTSILSLNVHYIDRDLIQKAHLGGIEICGWNCNEIEKARAFQKMELDWMGTDKPSLFANGL